LIAGLPPQHPATSGKTLVLGRPVTGPGADRGMVFQDYTSFDHRTVLENVTFGLECRGMPRRPRYEIGRQWIKHVGLDMDRDQDKYPHELSGGMRQRVAIARTLILQPRIILMDEPFGALDPQTRMHMQDLLISLWREVQATVFFVTHSVDEAVFLGDRVYVMSSCPGTILQELKVEPADRPARLMRKEPRFQETVAHLRDLLARLEEEGRTKVE
jgi:NitT/TauT family transport system ATP-binding protein